MEQRFENIAKLAAVFILVAGCFLVLRPFLTATLFAAVLCISTWPVYLRLLRKTKDRRNIAALIMTLSLTFVIILPLAFVAYNLADSITSFYNWVKVAFELQTVAPPTWIKEVPIVGASVDEYWKLIVSSKKELNAFGIKLLEPTKNFLLAGGLFLGQGVMEMSLSAFISFFFYRDGTAILRFLNVLMDRIIGIHTKNILSIINNTVQGVMYGLLGTALAQGLVATIGFMIAGVPAPMMLGATTALLSLLPIGPPLVWGGAAMWLFFQGTIGWGIFMLLWGFILISSVDNFVKPFLISRSSNLPFILILFGVIGGVLSFGFVGVFIGPTLLAVGFSLIKEWSTPDRL